MVVNDPATGVRNSDPLSSKKSFNRERLGKLRHLETSDQAEAKYILELDLRFLEKEPSRREIGPEQGSSSMKRFGTTATQKRQQRL